MKVTDIMVGDLVRLKNTQETIRVKELINNDVDWIVHQGINGSWECFECVGWYSYDDIEPIPLTGKILKKNHLECLTGFNIYFRGNGEDIAAYRIFPEYVHQLQHILRICGRCDDADNFKI